MLSFELVNNLKIDPNEKLIKKITKIFSEVKKIKKANFTLVLVTSSVIKKLNNNYRNKDKVTDVLSFACCDEKCFFPEEKKVGLELGEILICWLQLKKQAKEYSWPVDYEFARLLIHGLAHLLGYDHENVSQKKAQAMEKFEKKIINKVFSNSDFS